MDKKGLLNSERNSFFFYGPKEVSNCGVNLSLSNAGQENSLSLSKTFLLRYKLGHVMLHLKSVNALSVDSQQKEYLLMMYKACMA